MRYLWHAISPSDTRRSMFNSTRFVFLPTEITIPLTYIYNGIIKNSVSLTTDHDDVIKWKYFPSNWPFVRAIHLWPVNTPHKGQWHGLWPLLLTSFNFKPSMDK